MADLTQPDPNAGTIPPSEMTSALGQSSVPPPVQQGQADPGQVFQALPTPVDGQSSNRYSEGQTLTTAALASLAQRRVGIADPGTAQGRLDATLASNQAAIEAGQEKSLRYTIAQAARTNQVQTINGAQETLLMNPPPEMAGMNLKDLLTYGQQVKNSPLDGDELEMQGVAHVQTQAAQDPDQAALFQELQKRGDVLDQVRSNVIKMQLFSREIDARQKALENQGWGGKLFDFAADLTGLPSIFGSRVDVTGKGGLSLFDLPATRLNKQALNIWDMGLDEFRENLPSIMDKVQSASLTSEHEALNVAKDYFTHGLNNQDSLDFNVMQGINIAGYIPFGKMAQFARVPSKMVRVLGDRALSSNIAASTLAAEEFGFHTGLEGLQEPAHSVEESLPSSLVPSTDTLIRPDVGVPNAIADHLAQVRAQVAEAKKAMATQDRLAPEQMQAALERQVEEIRLQYKDQPIADMKAEPLPLSREDMAEMDLDNLSRANAEGRVPGLPEEEPRHLFDPDADLDNLSYVNARGEVYSGAERQAREELGGVRTVDDHPEFGVSRNNDTGIYSLNFYLGKAYGEGGFITEEGARAAADRRGLGGYDIHQNSDGQYFIKVNQPVRETGIAAPVLTEDSFPRDSLPQSFLRFLFRIPYGKVASADSILPNMWNGMRISQTVGKSKYMASAVKPYVDMIRKGGDLKTIAKIMTRGEEEQKWYNIGEFNTHFENVTGRAPKINEIKAYYAAKELSDLNYHALNAQLFADKARRGVQTVSVKNPAFGIDSGEVNGRVVTKEALSGHVFDLDEGTSAKGDPEGKLQQKLDSGNYRLINLEQPIQRSGQDPIHTVLAHNASSTVGPLKPEQLGYVEGGSRQMSGKWFVKQARSGVFADGTKYWENPVTHINSVSYKGAKKWADEMEQARLAYFSDMSEADKRAAIEKSPAESYDKFKQLVDDGTIQRSHPFEALYDRTQPSAMTHLGEDPSVLKFIDKDASAEEGYYASKGRMYYSQKGERLRDPDGMQAKILDPWRTLHNATTNAAQTWAFSAYNKRVAEEWSRVAMPYIDRSSVGSNLDPYNVFQNGQFSSDFMKNNKPFYNQLEAARNTHKRLLGVQSPEERLTEDFSMGLGKWLENSKAANAFGPTFNNWLTNKAYNISTKNPIAGIKAAVFHSKLGFFNPAQLFVQAQTAFAAVSVHPLLGARTVAAYPATLHLLMNRDPAFLETMAQRVAPVLGLNTNDYKEMIQGLRNSGWLNVSGEQAQLDNYANRMGGSALMRYVKPGMDAGLIFYNTAEQINRITAYKIAFQDIRNRFKDLPASSREFQNLLNDKTNSLAFGMTHSSAAWWQQGILAVPTQFLAYQHRMLEAMLPEMFGGSAAFSGRQKALLAGGQALMYGAGGIPTAGALLDYANKKYQDATGKQLDPDTWRKMSKGLFDTVLWNVSGHTLDTDFSERAGQGGAWDQLYDKLTNGDLNNFLDGMGGASVSTLGRMGQAFGRIISYMQAEQGSGTLSEAELKMMGKDLLSQVSTFTNAEKAYWIYKTGQIKDPVSGQVMRVPKEQAWAEFLGAPARQEGEFWKMQRSVQEREKAVTDYAKVIVGIRRNYHQAVVDGDDKAADDYLQLATGLMQVHRDDPLLQMEIAKEAARQGTDLKDKWKAMIMKYMQTTGRKPQGGF